MRKIQKEMTRENAINNLEMIRVAFVDSVTKEQRKLIDDTFDMAIKALEQELCDDAISRKEALASIKNLYPDMPIVNIMGTRQKWLEKYAPYFECENAIEQLPLVYPQNTDVLDKIRAEIEKECEPCIYEIDFAYKHGLLRALEIIDKYRKGQTDADSD